jgi:hypothetical protein
VSFDLAILFYRVDLVGLLFSGSSDIVWTKVERPDDVEGNFAIETEALEASRGDLVTVLVEGAYLRNIRTKDRN